MSIRPRRVCAAEVLEGYLAQIASHNMDLHAIVTLDEEGARTRAKAADAALARGKLWGPLHGVPVTIKDAIETAGLRTMGGFLPLAEYVPTTNAPVVARLRATGAIIMGKTNVPVLAPDYRADNPIFGRTNNPWALDRPLGGSTGGVRQRSRRVSRRWKSAAISLARCASPPTIAGVWAETARVPGPMHWAHSRSSRHVSGQATHEYDWTAGAIGGGLGACLVSHYRAGRASMGGPTCAAQLSST